MTVEIFCKFCGCGFEVIQSRAEKAKYCSAKCSADAQAARYAKNRVSKVCPACQSEFSMPKCHEHRRTYCSTRCANANKPYNGPRGSDHHLWNGGKTHHSGGYVYELCKGHPFASTGNYVFQHRLVVERQMRMEASGHPFLVDIDGQQYLRPDVEVHHFNEVKDDNQIGNLVACTAAGHHAFHHGLRVSQDQYWPHTVKPNKQHGIRVDKVCIKCHKEFQVKAYRANTARYCSRDCRDGRSY